MIFNIFTYVGILELMLLSFNGFFFQKGVADNRPPKVLITKPTESSKISWNSMVPYSIHVNDPEDGNSEYDEIAANQVLLMVNYFSKPDDADKFLSQGNMKMPEPLSQMSKSTCLLCHASKAKLIGPSFDLIAERYNKNPAVIETLTTKVISGSTGSWGELIMPTHPDLKVQQVRKFISWILENGSNPYQTFYLGTEGVFRTVAKPNGEAGLYALTASYADNGIMGVPNSNKQGEQTVTFKPE